MNLLWYRFEVYRHHKSICVGRSNRTSGCRTRQRDSPGSRLRQKSPLGEQAYRLPVLAVPYGLIVQADQDGPDRTELTQRYAARGEVRLGWQWLAASSPSRLPVGSVGLVD